MARRGEFIGRGKLTGYTVLVYEDDDNSQYVHVMFGNDSWRYVRKTLVKMLKEKK